MFCKDTEGYKQLDPLWSRQRAGFDCDWKLHGTSAARESDVGVRLGRSRNKSSAVVESTKLGGEARQCPMVSVAARL
jgi:hypothetical protein